MVNTFEGMVIVVSPEEEKALLPIETRAIAFSKVTVFSNEQDENALVATVVQSAGIRTLPFDGVILHAPSIAAIELARIAQNSTAS